MPSYHKLVRDKIPDIIKKNDEVPVIRILSDEEYVKELEKKLKEELDEVLLANGDDRLEELADLLEVISSLAETQNSSLHDIEEIAFKKREKRGSFTQKIYLEDVKKK